MKVAHFPGGDWGLAVALVVGAGALVHSLFPHPRSAPAAPRHPAAATFAAPNRLPKPPAATAPLVQRERRIIEANICGGAASPDTLRVWESLGEPPPLLVNVRG